MRKQPHAQRFGAHLSVAGGHENAIREAARLGCDCVQIFVKNQLQWTAGPLGDEGIRAFQEARAHFGIAPVIAHASYLPNLASPNAVLRRRSIAAIIDELHRCHALGAEGLVLHPGAHMGAGVAAGLRRVAAALDAIHTRTPGCTTRLLLETTAGQGTTLGSEIAQFEVILACVRDAGRVGICLDTCHLFAAGYDLGDEADYERTMTELTRYVGLDRVKCIHVNDSKQACGSRKDRHEHIGRGALGRRAFVQLLNDARLAEVPRILETPKGRDGRGRDWDRVNLSRLRGLSRG